MKQCLFLAAAGVAAVLPSVGFGEWANPELVSKVESGEITEANVSWWGYDAKDATPFVRAAIASRARKLTLDGENRSWNVLPLVGRSDLSLVVPKGSELVAKRGEYHKDSSTLLLFDCASNVVVTGGGRIRMWFEDYTNRNIYAWSEWRHALSFSGCRNVRIENLAVCDSGGDGICLGTSFTNGANTDFTIRNVTLTRNNRQGISVISADRLLIERCVMEDTCGTLPMAGIDFEPNFTYQKLRDIVVRDCVSRRNLGSGFDFSVGNLKGESTPISITLENCRSEQNAKPTKFHHSDNVVHGFHGSIVFRNCVFDDKDQTRKPFRWLGGRDTISATFENCRAADPEKGGAVTPLGADCGWKAAGRPTNRNGTPVRRKRLSRADLQRAKIFDACPGQTVKLPVFHTRAGQRFLIYAARPGKVHLAGVAKKINAYEFKGVKFKLTDLAGKEVAALPAIMEFGKETVLDFTAPKAGFYALELTAGGHAFRMTETDAPIALVIPRAGKPQLSWNGGPGEAYLRVPADCGRFYLFATGGCGAAYQRAQLYDPDGTLVWDQDDIGCSVRYMSPGLPKAGVWKIRAVKAKTYGMYDYSFDVFGIHPFLFLSPEKTWEIPEAFDLGLELNGKEGWAGIPAHPAVLNPPCGYEPGTVMRLDGDWEFVAYDNLRVSSSIRKPEDDAFYAQTDWKRPFFGHLACPLRKIHVPGCWEAQGVGKAGMSEPWYMQDCAEAPIRHKMMGIGWYRREVTIPKAWDGKRIWLKLGGIRGEAHVWLNDEPVAIMNEYVADKKFEVTRLVEPGETAKIVFEIDNRASTLSGCPTARNRWGGLCRAPELEATPETFLDDVWVRGDFDRQRATVKVEVGGERRNVDLALRATVEGETVQVPLSVSTTSFDLEVSLRNFRPWHTEHPNLYTAFVSLVENGTVVQTWRERFGVRKIEVRGGEFYLNGKPFYMRGYGEDSVHPITGIAIGDHDFHRKMLSIARAAGFNQTRMHSHCEFPEYFDVCDELGIAIEPELPYYGDHAPEYGVYDPPAMVRELYRYRRRHPSFFVYGMGNEGTHGLWMDRKLYRIVKEMDPDRLAISQSGNFEGNGPAVSDYKPIHQRAWEPGYMGWRDPSRPYTLHEYLNLCVKSDSRDEQDYTGVWAAPATRAGRAKWLSRFGLGMEWGDRLQDAQFALQRHWQKAGIENARLDPFCDGFSFWTIVDVVVWNARAETFSSQGLFDPFWRPKRGGFAAKDIARFNSASCVLVDLEGTNRVYRSGEAICPTFKLSHFGDSPLANASLKWRLMAENAELGSGCVSAGRQELGGCRDLCCERIVVPDVPKGCKVTLEAILSEDGRTVCQNSWDVWLFPKEMTQAAVRKKAAERGVVIAREGTPEAESALREGRNAVIVGTATGIPNIKLGWWWMGSQMGIALRSHPALDAYPHEGFLTPLLFRIVGEGRPLPIDGFDEDDFLAVGEGGESCYGYLAQRRFPNGNRAFFSWGLDLLADVPEAAGLLDSIVSCDFREVASTPNRRFAELPQKSRDWWMKLVSGHKAAAAALPGRHVDLVFVGDSITHFWHLPGDACSRGDEEYAELEKEFSVLNLGIAGDRTQNLLWRLEGGELDGYDASVVMLAIGTNNRSNEGETPQQTATAVSRILSLIRCRQPRAKVLLLPIFPRGQTAEDKNRRENDVVNQLLKPLADGRDVIWLDFTDRLLEKDGSVRAGMLQKDLLHLDRPAYRIWRETATPYFRKFAKGR